ncbi:MerC domain-containing protein [Paraferrimonas sedimenticola]|uniref:MerC mercury resistance protein n=1 Tax=Paraferrimonas sedimenticola TaxID=375674 RepID=A0AA37RWS6_9GAMM|nr:MerC domain-containing protein [Paraferrimonas sedimenticola]GLP96664.1 hypothetical protein GCM10007895_19700 [Paraferrimonas sedimenticola]
MKAKSTAQTLLDKFSIGASGLCALHCLLTPVLLATVPSFAAIMGDEHVFHMLLLWLILPCSAIAAFLGCTRHKDAKVMLGILAGIGLLAGTALFGHDLVGELGEKLFTMAGASVLAFAHWRNYKLCQAQSCDH